MTFKMGFNLSRTKHPKPQIKNKVKIMKSLKENKSIFEVTTFPSIIQYSETTISEKGNFQAP